MRRMNCSFEVSAASSLSRAVRSREIRASISPGAIGFTDARCQSSSFNSVELVFGVAFGFYGFGILAAFRSANFTRSISMERLLPVCAMYKEPSCSMTCG